MKFRALVLLAALSSCNEAPRVTSEDCLNLPVYPPVGVEDPHQTAIACVEQWAARYARGPDQPAAIADAAIEKCKMAILRNVESASRQAGEAPQYNDALEAWKRHALPVIAEARARRCYS